MSEYADITINNLSLMSFRNYLVPDIVSLFFSKSDLIITPNYRIDLEDEDTEGYTQYIYKTTVKKLKKGLMHLVLVFPILKMFLTQTYYKQSIILPFCNIWEWILMTEKK